MADDCWWRRWTEGCSLRLRRREALKLGNHAADIRDMLRGPMQESLHIECRCSLPA